MYKRLHWIRSKLILPLKCYGKSKKLVGSLPLSSLHHEQSQPFKTHPNYKLNPRLEWKPKHVSRVCFDTLNRDIFRGKDLVTSSYIRGSFTYRIFVSFFRLLAEFCRHKVCILELISPFIFTYHSLQFTYPFNVFRTSILFPPFLIFSDFFTLNVIRFFFWGGGWGFTHDVRSQLGWPRESYILARSL